jgi:hypothetical protein
MFDHRPAVLFLIASLASAQAPLENDGRAMRVAYECASVDARGAGLGCAEGANCPVYIELANIDALGDRIFITGNLHTPMVTLASILLVSDNGGKTWMEPHPRIPSSGLDQIQFLDFQSGWISGANLQGSPRDPFLLITSDGGKTWREQEVFDETRVAAIERFRFDTLKHGILLIDAGLDNGHYELYQTHDGGTNWMIQQTSEKPIAFPDEKPANRGWRVRTDAPTHSYVVEKPQSSHWQSIASFLVQIATCKE